jgi:type II secretory pathway pseudopilin PulG
VSQEPGESPLIGRIVRRLCREERGFSLLETIVALLLLFALLAALESAAVAGFRYVGFARERQAATAIANQIMEETRGLAYAKVKAGVQTSTLATDPNAVTGCANDPLNTYRFKTCSGEVIISTATNCPGTSTDCLVPLVPNSGTCGSRCRSASSSYPSPTWRTYVTNDNVSDRTGWSCSASWTKSVSTQRRRSDQSFLVADQCVSRARIFAAPCSPFFYGQATASKGTVTVAGSLASTTFSLGTLDLGKGESLLQQEQVSQVQGTVADTGTSITDGAGTRSGGSTTAQTNAVDADPASAAPQYQATTLTGVLSSSSTAGTRWLRNIADDAGCESATAGGTAVCPPPTVPPRPTTSHAAERAAARNTTAARPSCRPPRSQE